MNQFDQRPILIPPANTFRLVVVSTDVTILRSPRVDEKYVIAPSFPVQFLELQSFFLFLPGYLDLCFHSWKLSW